jgi:hypothetical protein
VFDVGSLLLTTLDPGTDWTANGDSFSATFTGAGGSTAAIQILDGATISALAEGSYVAPGRAAYRTARHRTVQVRWSAIIGSIRGAPRRSQPVPKEPWWNWTFPDLERRTRLMDRRQAPARSPR